MHIHSFFIPIQLIIYFANMKNATRRSHHFFAVNFLDPVQKLVVYEIIDTDIVRQKNLLSRIIGATRVRRTADLLSVSFLNF